MTRQEQQSDADINFPLLNDEPFASDDNPSSTNANSELKGYLLMFLSCVGYSTMILALDAAENSFNVQPFVAIMVRGLVQLVLSAIAMILLRVKSPIDSFNTKQQWQALIIHGISSALTTMFFAYCLKYLSSAESMTLYFSAPIFIMILSYFLLKEPITKVDVTAAFLTFLGVVLISKPSFASSPSRYIGVILGILTAIASSIALISIRWVGKRVHFLFFVAALSIFELICVVPFAVGNFFKQLSSNHLGMMLATVSGIAGFFAHSCLSNGLQHCNAGRGALIRTFDVPILYIMGLILLGEESETVRLIGSFLVISGAALIALQQIRDSMQ